MHVHVVNDVYNAQTLSAAACAYIAAARSRLVHLSLAGLSLPAATFLEVLLQLTGLTYLNLASGIDPSIMSFEWLTASTALRELLYVGVKDSSAVNALPCQLLAALPRLDTLCLAHCSLLTDPYLEALCSVLPQLGSLDFSHDTSMLHWALQHLTNLQVLDLETSEAEPELLEHVSAPFSLQRGYLGDMGMVGARAESTSK